MTHEQREILLEALEADLKKERTKEDSIKRLIKLGVLTNDGKPSPNYYPAQ